MAKTLEVRIRGDAASVLGALEQTERKISAVGRRAERLGRDLTTGITLPLAAIGAGATKASLDAENAFTEMAKTVDAPIEQLEALRDRFEELSERTIPKSANELTRIAALGGQLGIATEALEGFVKTVAALDVSTDLGAEEAARGLAQFANVMGTAQSNFDRLGSVLVDLGNNLATTESRILEMAQRLAGAGRQIGLTEAQVLSFAGALSSLGLEAEGGGSAFSKVFETIARAAATGGAQLATFAKVAGTSAAEFRELFARDAASAIVAFVEGLGRLRTEGRNVFAVLDRLGLSERRVTDAVLRASNATGELRKALERGDRAWTDNIALTAEAQKFYERAGAALQRLANQAVNSAAEFGKALEPAFRAALDAGRLLIDRFVRPAIALFTALPSPIQTAVIAFAALSAATGPVLAGFGRMAQVAGSLITVFRTLTGPAALAGLASLLTPGGAILGGLAALGGLFYLLNTRARDTAARMDEAATKLSEIGAKAAGATRQLAVAELAANAILAHRIRQQVAQAEAEVNRLEARAAAFRSAFQTGPIRVPFVGEALAPRVTGLNVARAELQGFQELAKTAEENAEAFKKRLEELHAAAQRTPGVIDPAAGSLDGFGQAAADAEERTARFLEVMDEYARGLRDIEESQRRTLRTTVEMRPAWEQIRDLLASIQIRGVEEAIDRLRARFQDLASVARGMKDAVLDSFTAFLTGAQGLVETVRGAIDRILEQFVRLKLEEAFGGQLEGFFGNLVGVPKAAGALATAEEALDKGQLAAAGVALNASAGLLDSAAVAHTSAASTAAAAHTTAATTAGAALTSAAAALIGAASAVGAKGIGDAFGALKAVIGAGKRAGGGPTLAGLPYWVGEEGPEIFVPRKSGLVLPAALSRGIAGFGVGLPGIGVLGIGVLGAPGMLSFATGGRPRIGAPSIVGERGPELFIPDRTGTVVPSDVTGSMLRGGGGGGRVRETHIHQTINFITETPDLMAGDRWLKRHSGTLMGIVRQAAREGVR